MSYEMEFWSDCGNTLHEEQKQIAYAARMGLRALWGVAHPPTYDLRGKSVIDIGGGPVSLLLKCVDRGEHCVVVDPGTYPAWVRARYRACGIHYVYMEAELFAPKETFDEAWIYNVLSHVQDPRKIIENARGYAKTIRIFDWLEDAPRPGHPTTLHAEELDKWLGAPGFVSDVNESGAVGRAYYGVFSANPDSLAQ